MNAGIPPWFLGPHRAKRRDHVYVKGRRRNLCARFARGDFANGSCVRPSEVTAAVRRRLSKALLFLTNRLASLARLPRVELEAAAVVRGSRAQSMARANPLLSETDAA